MNATPNSDFSTAVIGGGPVGLAANPEASKGCCGGPAPAGVDACCVKDADAKASGEAGCGCSDTSAKTEPVKAASKCCA